MSRIIVTGGAGFIGSEFVRQLNSKVVVIDKLTYASDLSRLSKCIFFERDISDYKSIEFIFRLSKPKIVVNFAAETHVDNSIKDSYPFIQTNIIGTKTLCDLCLEHNCLLVHISTDEVYGDIVKGKFIESDPLRPNNPYSATKASAELIIRAYVRTYNLESIIIRPSNNYGPDQNKEKLIPKIILNALDNKQIPIYGEGKQIREWIYVSDTCEGILKIIEKGKIGQVYNLGSGIESDNLSTVKLVLKHMGKPETLINFVEDRKGHDFRYSLDSNKTFNLGWTPKTSLSDGIIKTIEFYKRKNI